MTQNELVDQNQQNDSKLFENILSRLKSRFKARIMLQEAINSLKNLSVPRNDTYSIELMRFRVQSNIVSFKETTFEKFYSSNYTKHLLNSDLNEAINESDCLFFELILKNQNATLQSQIVINQDYPRVKPLLAINIHWKHDRNYTNDEAVRDMEREINLYREFYTTSQEEASSHFLSSRLSRSTSKIFHDDKSYDLFSKQMNHLMICFDIYLESESYFLNNLEYQRLKMFPNTVR